MVICWRRGGSSILLAWANKRLVLCARLEVIRMPALLED